MATKISVSGWDAAGKGASNTSIQLGSFRFLYLKIADVEAASISRRYHSEHGRVVQSEADLRVVGVTVQVEVAQLLD